MTDRINPMSESAVLVDATVVLHSLGEVEPHRSRCRAFLRELWSGTGRAYASTEMVQEVVFHRMRRTGQAQAVADARDIARYLIILNFDHEVLETALALIESTEVRGRDAVHAATALAYGIETIASSDPAFDGIPGLRRLDPLLPRD
ncbi:type II toxin-antitoxin system VapC family toxin [Microbacterium sp. A84]|uniref:type II toxin-antitoxin system VapC family toxin n=1 Tax=Microbacterium sp. A84 TaxID=3450715 RepID=UPI003F43DE7A